MHSRLEPILLKKKNKVDDLYELIKKQPEHEIAKILQGKIRRISSKSFKQALRQPTLAIIAEIKRRSPSNGPLAAIPNPIELAHAYVGGGADALSILTEEDFFDGKLEDLTTVASALREYPIPILRKDFILDEIQIAESIFAGADAILCIMAALNKKAKVILERARDFGIDVLVEVIDRAELEMAIEFGAEVVGINNRDLKTFVVDPERSFRLVNDIPSQIIKVAASGITDPAIAKQYYQAGFDAVLIGEALVKSADPAAFIRNCR